MNIPQDMELQIAKYLDYQDMMKYYLARNRSMPPEVIKLLSKKIQKDLAECFIKCKCDRETSFGYSLVCEHCGARMCRYCKETSMCNYCVAQYCINCRNRCLKFCSRCYCKAICKRCLEIDNTRMKECKRCQISVCNECVKEKKVCSVGIHKNDGRYLPKYYSNHNYSDQDETDEI